MSTIRPQCLTEVCHNIVETYKLFAALVTNSYKSALLEFRGVLFGCLRRGYARVINRLEGMGVR